MGPAIAGEGLDFVVSMVDEMTPILEKLIGSLDGLTAKMGSMGGEASSAGGGMDNLTTSITKGNLAADAIKQAFEAVIDTLKRAVSTMADLGMQAARVEELGMALQVIGQRAGYTSDQINNFVKGIETQNITTQAANQELIALAQAHVSLSQGTQLAAAAQALAIPAMKSSSETLQILTHVIQTHNEMELQSLNIGADLMQAERSYAQQHNVSIQSLDSVARSQIAMNLILEKAKPFADLYGISLNNAGKSMDSLHDRITMIGQELGRIFLPVLDEIVPAINRVATGFRDWLVEHRPALEALGNALKSFLDNALRPIANFIAPLANAFEQLGQAISKYGDNSQQAQAATANIDKMMQPLVNVVNFTINAFMALVDAVKIVIDAIRLLIDTGVAIGKFFDNLNQAAREAGVGLAQGITDGVKGFLNGLGPLGQGIETVIGWMGKIVSAAQQAGAAIAGILGQGVKAGASSSNKDISNLFKDIGHEMDDIQGKRFNLDNIVKEFGKVQKGISVAADPNFWDAIPNAANGAGNKLADELHRMQETMQNMATENAQYVENVARRTEAFNDQLLSLVQQHLQKAQQLRDQIKGLNSDFASADQDRLDSHNDKRQAITDQYDKETETIKANLNKRLSESHKNDDDIVKFYQAQLDARTKKRDDDLKKEDDQFKKEEDKQKSSFQKQLDAVTTQLNTEMALEQKHQADFDKFKDAANQDDIDRAENQFGREMDQMKQQHDKRMAELQRELEDEARLKDRYAGTSTAGKTAGYTPTGGTSNYKAPVAPKQVIMNNTINKQVDINRAVNRAFLA